MSPAWAHGLAFSSLVEQSSNYRIPPNLVQGVNSSNLLSTAERLSGTS